MAKRLVIVMGHSGSGKDSIITFLEKKKRYTIVNLGDVMHELAKKKKLVERQDEIKELDDEAQEALRNEAVRHVSKMSGNVILNTHPITERHGRYLPGLHHYVKDQLKHVSGFLYVDADPETILKRTNKDKKEKWAINMQKEINLAILNYHASQLDVPLYIISNNEGQQEQAQEQASKHVESIFTS